MAPSERRRNGENMASRKFLLLNGPNLDMLGVREPEVYGRETLATLEQTVRTHVERLGGSVTCYQSNNEGKLVGKIHDAMGKYDGIVYNPGAHTHYSYALRDAIACIDVPVVEVHLSDVDAREPFRRVSVIAPVCVAQVKGLGVRGYCRAVDVLMEALEDGNTLRLGEGYESRFAPGENVRIAGRETVKSDDDVAGGSLPFDLTGEFAAQLAGIDMSAGSRQRLAAVRASCEEQGLDALIVRDTPNIHWLTAFDGVFDEERAHALLVTRDCAVLHTDSRYSNAMRVAAAGMDSPVVIDDGRMSHLQFAHRVLVPDDDDDEMFKGRLGIEDTIAYAEYAKATSVFPADSLHPTSDVVLSLRAVKDPAEILRLRAAQAITDAAFLHIVDFMRPGMTEREVQLELEGFMLRNGADGLAFGSIVACGENGADPHSVPSDKKLEAGQCVVMDFGARAFGYCSDMTRMVFLGEPQGTMARAWDVLRQANEAVEQMLRPGVTGVEAHNLAEQVLADGGFGGKMGHGLGHGVGLVCHELPVLNTRNESPLVEGNVVTVEPGIYLPGEFGMRLEDCGVITADGYDVFSRLGHDTVVL